MDWLRRIFGGGGDAGPSPLQATGARGMEDAWRAHAAALRGLPEAEERGRIVDAWRVAIDREATAYADLIAEHPAAVRARRAEEDVLAQAWLTGYMAGRGWIRQAEALSAAFSLGRALRADLRAMGVPIEQASLTIGVTMDEALEAIVAMGASVARERGRR